MERLSGLDAGFLYMETPTLHMHTIKVVVFDAVGDIHGAIDPGHDQFIGFVRRQVARRMDKLPPLRRRLVEVPFGFHHPVWIDDPAFDIEFHVRRVVVPGPGGPTELDAVVADIAGRPLDRSRPLWEMHVCEGLANGRVGVIVKIHHCVADGVAAAALLANVMELDPDADSAVSMLGEGADQRMGWLGEPIPGPARLLRDALLDHLAQLRSLPALVLRTLGNLIAMLRHRRGSEVATPRPVIDAPRTSFNGALTPHRSFATTSLSLSEVKRIKEVFGVTVNDVILAAAGGALRAYLTERGELPDRSLLAGVPIASDRPGDPPRLSGNKVSNLFTSLSTDVKDPARRLAVIHEVTAEAKLVQSLLGIETLQQWVQYTPPRPYSWVVRQWSRVRVADQMPPPINAVVSNVPGPRQALYAGGARLEHLYSVGPILEGIGLNITVWSYLDGLDVGVLACREAIPDPHRLTTLLHAAIAELGSAAEDQLRETTDEEPSTPRA